MNARFLPAGDAALVVEFGDEIDRTLSERVLALAGRIRGAALAGVIHTVPTFRSVMVHYDPTATSGTVTCCPKLWRRRFAPPCLVRQWRDGAGGLCSDTHGEGFVELVESARSRQQLCAKRRPIRDEDQQ